MQIELLQEVPGFAGVVLAFVVLVAVYAMKRARLTVTGDQARLANIILSAFLTYQTQDISQIESTLVFVISSLLSSGIHLLFEWLNKRKTEQSVG